MILIGAYHSLHMTRMICESLRHLDQRGVPPLVVAFTEMAAAEIQTLGLPFIRAGKVFRATDSVERQLVELAERAAETDEDVRFHGVPIAPLMRHSLLLLGREANGSARRRLAVDATRYLLCAERIFDLFRPSAVIVWNGTRMESAAYLELAKARGIPTRQVERGPLPGTMFCDASGINGGASVTRLQETPDVEAKDVEWSERVVQRYRSSGQSAWEQPARIEDADLLRACGVPPNKRIALYACQVPDDTNIVAYSPFKDDYMAVFDWLARAYADATDTVLVVKKHPKGPDLKEVLRDRIGPNTIWVDRGNIQQWLALAHHVVCINSTVGFEAALCGKPVILLGQAFYGGTGCRNWGLTEDCSSGGALKDAVKRILGRAADQGTAANATRLLATLHARMELLDTESRDDQERWVDILAGFCMNRNAHVGLERIVTACNDWTIEVQKLGPESQRFRDEAALWKSNYLRLAGTFPLRHLLRLRRWFLGLDRPPWEEGS